MKPEKTAEDAPVADATAEGGQESEMVEVHDASIDDLDVALQNAQAEEAGSTGQEADPAANAPVPAAAKVALETPLGEEVKSPEREVAAAGAEPSKPRVYTQEEVQGILAENERHKKEGNQKELFIQHRGNELGTLRSQNAQQKRELAAMRAQLQNGLEDRFSENPNQAITDRERIKEIDSQIEGLENQEKRAERIVEAQTFFLRHVDTEKVTLDDVASVLKGDGVDENYIAQFKTNPWEFTTPEALVQMGKRAMDRKEYAVADSDRRILAKHVQHLNNEIAKLKTRPGQVVSRIQQHLNQGPSVTAASNVSSRTARNIDEASIPQMSDAELDAALKNATSH